MCARLYALVFLVGALSADAQDLTTFERILIPVSVTRVEGAFGSVWSTELWYRNNSSYPVAVFPLAVSDWVPTIRRTHTLPVGNGPASAPGQFIYVSRVAASDVQLDLRLFNRADPRNNWGTKLPTVRDQSFRTGAVSLINVPTSGAFRAALRIYGTPEGPREQSVTVRFFSHDEKLLAARVLELNRNGTAPRYAQLLTIAGELPEDAVGKPVRIEIEGGDVQTRLWAFVSVTANETEFVSVITPD